MKKIGSGLGNADGERRWRDSIAERYEDRFCKEVVEMMRLSRSWIARGINKSRRVRDWEVGVVGVAVVKARDRRSGKIV